MMPIIKVILFDLGGVLIELGPNPVPQDWLKPDQSFQIEEWFRSATAIQFEKGHISIEEFTRQLKADLKLEVTTEEIANEFSQWPVGLYSGTEKLLEQINDQVQHAVLSNTNCLHWPRLIDEFKLNQFFESTYLFASFHLGMAKPDPEVFRHVVDEMGVTAPDVLFLDDNLANVQAARALGMNGEQVKGLDQVFQTLERFGLLKGSADTG